MIDTRQQVFFSNHLVQRVCLLSLSHSCPTCLMLLFLSAPINRQLQFIQKLKQYMQYCAKRLKILIKCYYAIKTMVRFRVLSSLLPLHVS